MSMLGGMGGMGSRGAGGLGAFGGGGGAPPKSSILTVTERDFQAEVLQSELPVLLQFSSERSQPCKVTAPELEAFARETEGKVRVLNVDIDRSPALAQQLRIQSLPTFMVFVAGRPVDGVAGPLKKQQLREMVEPHLPRAEGAIKPMELAEIMKEGGIVPVDTREKPAYDRAHLPGAKHMALEELESRLAELHMLGGQPVLYCRSGDKTKEMAARLAEQGMPLPYLEGGLLSWEAESLPIERP